LSGSDDTSAPEEAVVRRTALPKAIVVICLGLMLILGALFAAGRYGALLPQARLLIEARTNGLKIGSFGRLRIEGLSGDVWRDFRIRRLTLRDEKGIWLEARDLHIAWRYEQLLFRRFHADRIDASQLRLLRRPTLVSEGKGGGMPVSFYIDEAHARIEMLPDFSFRRGVYDLDLTLAVKRRGGQRGTVRAASVLSPGDHLNLQFRVGEAEPLLILADAAEAHGGALAGLLGLPSDQPFLLRVAADGRTSAGRFKAEALSGAGRPLQASGAWTPQGGQAVGRVALDASTWTAPYAKRLGSELRFTVSGRKAADGLYALDLQVAAENLKLRAQGLGDPGERRLGPKGLALALDTPALSRLTGGPQMGPARLTGVLTGAGARWRLAGAAAVNRLGLSGYTLDQLSGPYQAALDATGVTLKATLAGRGGRGAGWAAAILGDAPRASLEGARLRDGRISLRRFDLAGAGLKATATGGRGLLGGLNLKGEAQVFNLAAARKGAGGGLRIAWSAGQGRAGQPWTLKADATGQKLATGFAELDRLLGPSPTLGVQAALAGRRFSVSRGQLTGAAFKASSAGVLEADGRLSFKLDWSADGPFHAGPVEVVGHAAGGGALTGSLAAPRADLLADVQQIDLPRLPLRNARLTLTFQRRPDGSSGMIATTADSAYGPARARADFRFPQGGVDLTGLAVDAGGLKADGSLSLRRRTPSAANLNLTVVQGAFLESGAISGAVRIEDAPGGPRAQLNLTGQQVRMPGSTITVGAARLTAAGPLSGLPYVLQAEGLSQAGRFAADGRGVFATAGEAYTLSFDGAARLGGRRVRTVEPAVLRLGGGERSARLRLVAEDGGRVELDGRLTADDADVRGRLAGVGLSLLNEDLTGRLDATFNLTGRGGRLDGGLDARLAGARGRGAPAASGVDGTVQGRLAAGALRLDAAATNGQGLRANANLVLPVETSAAPFRLGLDPGSPLQGRFFADGQVQPLWDLLIGGERSLSGIVRTEGTLGGTLANPQARGDVTVASGRFDDGATGLSLRNVALRATFADEAVDVSQASGDDGHGGALSGVGRISLQRGGVSSFRLDLHRFRLIDNDQATASASGRATVTRGANGQVRLAGALTIDQADVSAAMPSSPSVITMDVVEKNRPATLPAALPTPAARGNGVALDVDLRAPGRIYLRGRGLNVELSLDAHVGGTTSRPDLSGTARVVRGDYDFGGVRFTFDTTSVVYLSTRPRDIRLDLSATRDDPTLSATVHIRGTAAQPEISFASTPSLPNDEVLSRVLFGQSVSQLSPVQAAQLASAVSSLARGGGMDVLGNLRAFAGLDRLAFGTGETAGVTVSGGKYLTDRVYLELSGGGREGPSAQVEWRVLRQLSVISRVGGQVGARLAVRWRKDY
jgi:translocation and assembly module TamB